MRRALTLLLLINVGCIFDRGGLPSTAPNDGPRPELAGLDLDLGRGDGDAAAAAADGPPDDGEPDALQDSALGDLPPDASPTDSAPLVTPITAAALGAEWGKAQVPCVDSSGTATGQQIAIVDGASPKFFPGSTCLAGASQDTLSWVGGLSCACILWDPNACGGEEKPGDSNWDTAGLLVRRGALDGQQRLVLEAATTVADIDLVNINADGSWQAEFAKPDDSELATTYKQLVNPVAEAKKLVIQLGK